MKKAFILLISLALSYAVQAQWKWLYPQPTGNFLASVVLNENGIGLAVGTASTIIRTTDYGATWQNIIFDEVFTFNKVILVNDGIGYIVGNEGCILKTLNYGLTWYGLTPGTSKNLYGISFIDSFNGYVVGDEGTILRTTNGGITWEDISYTPNYDIKAVSFIDTKQGCAVGNYGTLLMTSDGGETWNRSTPAYDFDLSSVCMIDNNRIYMSGEHGCIFRTKDGGSNWASFCPGGMDAKASISFLNQNIGFAVVVCSLPLFSEIFKTINGGDTWLQIYHEDSLALMAASVATDSIGVVVGGHGNILTTFNQGQTWSKDPNRFNYNFSELSCLDENTAIIIGDCPILKTEDGGLSWNAVNNGQRYSLGSSFFLNDTLGFACGLNEVVVKTIDAGDHWTEIHRSSKGRFGSLQFLNLNTGYCLGQYDSLYKTVDGGYNWTLFATFPTHHIFDFKFLNDSIAIAVGLSPDSNVFYKTTNGGLTWIEKQAIVSPFNYIWNLNFPSFNVGYASGYKGILYKTTDNGETWQNISLGINQSITDLTFINENDGFLVGPYSGVLATHDGGLNWNAQTLYSSEYLADIEFANDSTGFVVGRDGVILKTTNGGTFTVNIENMPSIMKNFTIYPNPADQFMQVLTNHGYPINEIRVYNMEGALAMVVKNPKTTPISIATHGLSNGLYLVQIITNDQIETRKIVVTH